LIFNASQTLSSAADIVSMSSGENASFVVKARIDDITKLHGDC
jgi:hypothetical protein